ncbi:hypothetical protein LPA44_07585 [Halobacterium sp. KA-4]|uniref:hypothetical protein n=1 Tax=Halobacterium sp. KA-4 TaxID=2896367 RepID=UPI001E4BF952|nr:hypothetical protein [Halobacterium sp. KA-4]MCD2199757.1 hypothetical protein [Halobacterium sp. KA-4]
MAGSASEKIRDNRDTLAALATSDLNSAKWARELLEAVDVNYKCGCGGYLQPTDRENVYRCADCERETTEIGGGRE